MCTCMWSAKTLTLRVWRTKNTGTRSQQIISLSLKVRALGCWGPQEFHTMALLCFSCKFVSTNPPLSARSVFRRHSDAGSWWEGFHQRRKQWVVEATSPLSCLSQRARHHTCTEGTHQVSFSELTVFQEWKDSLVLICIGLDIFPVILFSVLKKKEEEQNQSDVCSVKCAGWVSIVLDSFLWLFHLWRFNRRRHVKCLL